MGTGHCASNDSFYLDTFFCEKWVLENISWREKNVFFEHCRITPPPPIPQFILYINNLKVSSNHWHFARNGLLLLTKIIHLEKVPPPITSARSSDTDNIWLSVVLCCRVAAQLVSVMYYEEPELLPTESLTPAPPCISYYKQSKLNRLVYDDSRQLEWCNQQ